MAVGGFRIEKLEVWKFGMDLVTEVYRVTRMFPTEERIGLIPQLRRSSVSIPAILPEDTDEEANQPSQTSRIAQGSLFEFRIELEVAVRIGLTTRKEPNQAIELTKGPSRMLDGLIRSLALIRPPTANR